MRLNTIETVEVPAWALKKAGLWEDAKRRFGLTDDVQVVRLMKGTVLHRNFHGFATANALSCESARRPSQ